MSETAHAVRDRLGAVQEESSFFLGELAVNFKEGDPCRPQYAGLYHYPSGQNGQLEPAFQINRDCFKGEKVSIRFSLKDSSIEFVEKDDPLPLCREIDQKTPDNKFKINYHKEDKGCCVLTYELPKKPSLHTFRIYCKKKNGEFTAQQKVHGGIFVVFSTFTAGKMGKQIAPPSHQHDDHHRIHLLGADKHHRPIYDIHKSEHPTHEGIEIEPAYRLRRWQTLLEFRMNMKIEYAQWHDKVNFPEGKPTEITHKLDAKDSFLFKWTVKDPKNAPAKVCAFHLVPKLADDVSGQPLPPDLAEWGTWEEYAEALEDIGIDPTVIQPPTCDPAYGVCDPPPKGGDCDGDGRDAVSF